MSQFELKDLNQKDYQNLLTFHKISAFYEEEKEKLESTRAAVWEPWLCRVFQLTLANETAEFLQILICFEEDNNFFFEKIEFEQDGNLLICKAIFPSNESNATFAYRFKPEINVGNSNLDLYNQDFAGLALSFGDKTSPNYAYQINDIFNKIHDYIELNMAKFF